MTLIYLAGSDVALSVTIDGAGAVSLTVTDPAGTTSTPAVSSGGSGAYSAIVPAVSIAGVWLYRWTASGVAIESQFTVQAASVEQIVDLASVKAHLNMPATDTRQDDELTGYIYAASEHARNVCGPMLPETHTQFFDGGRPTITPDWLPLAAVVSVTEFYGQLGYVLTEQPLSEQMNAFAFTADYSTGTIARRTFGGGSACFAAGFKNVKVVYTAGSRPIPYTVRLGALELVRHLWQLTQQAGRPKFGSTAAYDSGDASVPMGFALPNRVLELWQPYRRPPGIA